VCAYFDVGNYVKYGPPQDWIRALGSRIKKVHLKDFKTSVQKKKVTQPDGTVVEKEEVGGSFVPLLEGSIDWKEVKRALDEIGYNGFMTAELKGGDEAYLKDVSARMDKIIAGA
jgi:hexulose-6-phosphate isomerase